MKLKEFQLIKDLKDILGSNSSPNIGIGDDCALVPIGKKKLLITVDSMTEGVHFLRSYPAKLVGEKLATINVSDIVACGGEPSFGVISLNIPKSLDKEWIKEFYRGVKKGAKKYNFEIIGGNTSSSQELSIALTLCGYTQRFISRKEAKVGDLVFLTGKTGMSKLGLELILEKKEVNPFFKHHIQPKARADTSSFLIKYANSAIDISDGLIQDLGHIAKSSNVTLDIDSKKVPLSKKLISYLGKKKALEYALSSGEEYQIAFTLHKRFKTKAEKKGFIAVGEVTAKKEKVLIDGESCTVLGFDHLN